MGPPGSENRILYAIWNLYLHLPVLAILSAVLRTLSVGVLYIPLVNYTIRASTKVIFGAFSKVICRIMQLVYYEPTRRTV